MILSMSSQVLLFCETVAIGAGVGLIYDFLRLFRRLVKHSVPVLNIEDALFWIFVNIGMFYFMLNQNSGEIRFFSILGFFIGMLLYFLTVSPIILKVLLSVALFLKRVFSTMVKIIVYPVKVVVNILKIPLEHLLSLYKSFKGKSKKVLQKSERYAKIKTRKLKQDLRIIFKKV